MKSITIPYSHAPETKKSYWRKELGDIVRSLYDDPDRRVKNTALELEFEDEVDAQKLIKSITRKPIVAKDGNEDKDDAGDDEGENPELSEGEGDDNEPEYRQRYGGYGTKRGASSYGFRGGRRQNVRGRGRGASRTPTRKVSSRNNWEQDDF